MELIYQKVISAYFGAFNPSRRFRVFVLTPVVVVVVEFLRVCWRYRERRGWMRVTLSLLSTAGTASTGGAIGTADTA